MTTRDALRAALATALWSFVGLFGLSLLGWLADLQQWASSSGASAFPSLSVLGYAAVAAVAAAVIAGLNFLWRLAQAQGWLGASYQAKGPDYSPSSPAGLQVGAGTIDTTDTDGHFTRF